MPGDMMTLDDSAGADQIDPNSSVLDLYKKWNADVSPDELNQLAEAKKAIGQSPEGYTKGAIILAALTALSGMGKDKGGVLAANNTMQNYTGAYDRANAMRREQAQSNYESLAGPIAKKIQDRDKMRLAVLQNQGRAQNIQTQETGKTTRQQTTETGKNTRQQSALDTKQEMQDKAIAAKKEMQKSAIVGAAQRLKITHPAGDPLFGKAISLASQSPYWGLNGQDGDTKIILDQYSTLKTAQGNVVPGAAPAAPVVPQAGPKQLDAATAKLLLQQAGGDKQKARDLAKQQGYTF